jgi:hypothetical protein
MTSNDAEKEAEMIVRQISWLRVYCLELKLLEQPGMPKENHQKIMALRGEAPHFFWLVSSLLKDALIVGLDSLLDGDKNGKQLTLEHVVKGLADPNIQKECQEQLRRIRKSACCREVAIARNNLIVHPNRQTLLRRDEMTTGDLPDLTISRLEDMLSQVTALAGLALGKSPSEFWFHEWAGVSQLFDRLRESGEGRS